MDSFLEALVRKFDNLGLESDSMDVDSQTTKVLAIDVGIKNLGLVFLHLKDDMTIARIEDLQLVDITQMAHHRMPYKKCTLHHQSCISDWLEHVFQEYPWFQQADHILVERQPITGIVAVEQLIMNRFRDKTILLCPSTMHRHFGIDNYDYQQRKECTIKIALYVLRELNPKESEVNNLESKFMAQSRCHDVADAICFAVYWSHIKNLEFKKKQRALKVQECLKKGLKNCTLDEWFDQFKRVA